MAKALIEFLKIRQILFWRCYALCEGLQYRNFCRVPEEDDLFRGSLGWDEKNSTDLPIVSAV